MNQDLRLSLPGACWEVLPQPEDLPSSECFGRRTKKGYVDCVLVFDRPRGEIIVAKAKIVWNGHSPVTVPGASTATFKMGNEFEIVATDSFATAVDIAGKKSRRDWRKCSSCAERMPYGFMADISTCMGCAPEVLGRIY